MRSSAMFEELAQRLGGVRHFAGLPPQAREAIVGAGSTRRFAAGSTLCVEGEPGAGMFVLLSGRVHLCRVGPRGHLDILSLIEPVIMFNEVTVLDGGPNPVMAMAVEDCVTWWIGYEPFQALLREYPILGLSLLPVLARRNRFLIARHGDVMYCSVVSRTAKLLLLLSDYGQQRIDRTQNPIQDLAARIGSVREPVSRALKSLRDDGLIACTRSEILVRQPKELAEQAGMEVLADRA